MTENMPDIEKTTISVRSFALAMWTVIGVLIVTVWLVAGAWYSMNSTLVQQGQTIVEQNKRIEVLTAQLTQAVQDIQQLKLDQAATVKRINDYRPFKWSVVMMTDWAALVQKGNPDLTIPDPRDTQTKDLPWTP